MSAEAIHLLGLPKPHTYDHIVGGYVQGNLLPKTTSLYYCGSSSKKWKGVYSLFNYCEKVQFTATISEILARGIANSKILFYGWDGAAHLIVAQVDTAHFDIPLAGDITFLDDKVLQWSDVNLYRSQANVLKTDDSLAVGINVFLGDSGQIIWGSGSDTNLYRSGVNILKTDDSFDAWGYRVGGAVGASGSFTTVDGKTVTVVNGLITSIV